MAMHLLPAFGFAGILYMLRWLVAWLLAKQKQNKALALYARTTTIAAVHEKSINEEELQAMARDDDDRTYNTKMYQTSLAYMRENGSLFLASKVGYMFDYRLNVFKYKSRIVAEKSETSSKVLKNELTQMYGYCKEICSRLVQGAYLTSNENDSRAQSIYKDLIAIKSSQRNYKIFSDFTQNLEESGGGLLAHIFYYSPCRDRSEDERRRATFDVIYDVIETDKKLKKALLAVGFDYKTFYSFKEPIENARKAYEKVQEEQTKVSKSLKDFYSFCRNYGEVYAALTAAGKNLNEISITSVNATANAGIGEHDKASAENISSAGVAATANTMVKDSAETGAATIKVVIAEEIIAKAMDKNTAVTDTESITENEANAEITQDSNDNAIAEVNVEPVDDAKTKITVNSDDTANTDVKVVTVEEAIAKLTQDSNDNAIAEVNVKPVDKVMASNAVMPTIEVGMVEIPKKSNRSDTAQLEADVKRLMLKFGESVKLLKPSDVTDTMMVEEAECTTNTVGEEETAEIAVETKSSVNADVEEQTVEEIATKNVDNAKEEAIAEAKVEKVDEVVTEIVDTSKEKAIAKTEVESVDEAKNKAKDKTEATVVNHVVVRRKAKRKKANSRFPKNDRLKP